MTQSGKTRVIVWGTGNVGYYGLRHALRHPHLEVVGVHAHSESKQGKDAGELAGLDLETGIKATNDTDALLALNPDCVIYTVNGEMNPEVAMLDMIRILEAGIDIVGTALIFLVNPAAAPPEARKPLEDACRKGGSTLFVNGIDPGYSGDVLPMTALQITDQVRQVTVQEIVDYSTYEDPEFTALVFGFGQRPEVEPVIFTPGHLSAGFGGMAHFIANAVGVELEELREVCESAYTDEDYSCPMISIKKGTRCAVRFQVQGMVKGEPFVTIEHVNRLGTDVAPHWPTPPVGKRGTHRVTVDGNPKIQIDCSAIGEDGDHNTGGVQVTILRMLNAIPAIMAHEPGIVSTLDLPYTPSQNVLPD